MPITRSNETDKEVIEVFEENDSKKAIDFPTCAQNVLDLNFYRNCNVSAEKDHSFSEIYNYSDDRAIHRTFDCQSQECKSVIENSRSFGSAKYDGLNEYMVKVLLKQLAFLTSTIW